MATKLKKPILIKVGSHLVDPTDVACISRVRTNKLYIVRLKSQPNMAYPIWVKHHEIGELLKYFEIKSTDIPELDDPND